ncbi:MAG TPA: TonB-dependent receptor plug domain-containing protein [Gemmatimonadaceae bacterium]|jgi:hypothetical protein
MSIRATVIAAAGMLVVAGGIAVAQQPTTPVAGFDARAAKHRGGVFFTREDLKNRAPARLSDLFRGMSGVVVANNDAGKVVLASSRGGRTVMTGTSAMSGVDGGGNSALVSGVRCPVLIGIDGQMMDPSFSIDDVQPSNVHGIEAYTGSARVPVEFGAGNASGCGVVMIWVKTGSDTP